MKKNNPLRTWLNAQSELGTSIMEEPTTHAQLVERHSSSSASSSSASAAPTFSFTFRLLQLYAKGVV